MGTSMIAVDSKFAVSGCFGSCLIQHGSDMQGTMITSLNAAGTA